MLGAPKMIRISKLTDYSIVLLSHLAAAPEWTGSGQRVLFSTRDLAEESHLPLPTVEKLLKKLTSSELLVSERGAHGGYRLAREPRNISIADIVSALEGPIALTECAGHVDACGLENICPTKAPWKKINQAILSALKNLSLAEMAQSARSPSLQRALPKAGGM